MDLDEEILQRSTNTEDHLTERKSRPHRDQCTEAMVAFANSALPNKPGILYVGVNDKGEVLQDKAPESWQYEITNWGNGCFPELQVIPRTLSKDGKEFLAMVVPPQRTRPHFARPAFRGQGDKTIPASPSAIPARAIPIPCLMTSARTSLRWAPSAMRMPISWVRCVTV